MCSLREFLIALCRGKDSPGEEASSDGETEVSFKLTESPVHLYQAKGTVSHPRQSLLLLHPEGEAVSRQHHPRGAP